MNIQKLIQNIENLNQLKLEEDILKDNQWFGRKIEYYHKHNKVIIDLVNVLSLKDNALEINMLKKLNSKITLISGQCENKKINEGDLDKLLFLTMKLHLNYIDFITNLDEDSSSAKLSEKKTSYFLKSLAKLDKLIRNKEASPRREFVDKVLAFCSNYVLSLDSYHLTSFPTQSTGYFVSVDDKDNKRILVYKPSQSDPEAFRTIPFGEGWRRQIVAYLVDLANGGRLNIPLTLLGTTSEHGFGSVQLFLKNEGMAKDFCGAMYEQILTTDLQLVSIHRSKLYELDGNLGNLLYKKKENPNRIEVISIDFDYALPEIQDVWQWENALLKISWLYFPKMDETLTQDAVDYIRGTDIDYETSLLQALRLPLETQCLYNLSFWVWEVGAEKKCSAGEIIDFLHSEVFKELYLYIWNEEKDSNEAISQRKNIYLTHLRAYMDEYLRLLEAPVEIFHQAEACLGKENYEEAIYHMQTLLQRKNYRLVFKLMRQIIQVNLQAGEKGISELQKYTEPRNELYAGFITLVYTLEEIDKEKAVELRDWVMRELD